MRHYSDKGIVGFYKGILIMKVSFEAARICICIEKSLSSK